LSLLSELSLEHEASLGRFIEEICPISKSIVTELLGDALRIWTFWTFFNEIIKEAQNLEIEALKAIIFIIVELLSNRVIIPLQKVLAFLV
jgi:hypothetical protein